jgi:hypothetical protein
MRKENKKPTGLPLISPEKHVATSSAVVENEKVGSDMLGK